ncbi:MAG TPA: hypothetical protein PLU72_09085 [Candidatus Ozemobacteraceae bacterium]|nr:hypothetical protein [Candidatus Ozemobacteraceae bacterium]
MKFPRRIHGTTGGTRMAYFLLAMLTVACPPIGFSAPPAPAPAQNGQALVAGAVDLAAVITFHPAMRNFDYRSGKFVSQVGVPGTSTGIEAWKETRDEQRRIKAMEEAIEAQVRRVNEELMRNQPEMQEGKKVARPEFDKLTRMNEEYRKLLAPLAERVLGGFPEKLLGDIPRQNLERIMTEVLWAVQASAQARGAAIVLNTSTGDFKPGTEGLPQPPDPGSVGILERWNIRSLSDIEALIQASGSTPMPFEGKRPKQRPGLVCGGHFESVTDPAMLKSLVSEFYDNRQAFSGAFLSLGATRHVLSGSINVTSVDLTSDAVARLLDLYKTRAAERNAIMNLLRERLGR